MIHFPFVGLFLQRIFLFSAAFGNEIKSVMFKIKVHEDSFVTQGWECVES